MSATIDVTFENGRVWKFKWDDVMRGWFYTTRQNTYQLFFNSQSGAWVKPIWIGRMYITEDCVTIWGTYESRLGAVKVSFTDGEYFFKRMWVEDGKFISR